MDFPRIKFKLLYFLNNTSGAVDQDQPLIMLKEKRSIIPFFGGNRSRRSYKANLNHYFTLKRNVPSKYYPFALCAYSKGGTLGNVPLSRMFYSMIYHKIKGIVKRGSNLYSWQN
jgi:hypothetical protein